MRRALVVLGGCAPGAAFLRKMAAESDFLLCADSGLDAAIAADVRPDAVIGDNTPLAGALAPLATDAGHELHKQGKHEAALQAYEEALRIDPNFAPAREARDALLNAEAAATVPSVAPPPLSENAPARP